MDLAWLSRQRAPAADAPSLQPVEAAAHPLHSAVPHARPDDAPRADPTVDDPLSAGASDPLSAASDPLTAASSDPLRGVLADPLAVSNTFSTLGSVQLQGVEAVASYGLRKSHFQDWKERRALILKQYAVAGHLRVSSDLLNADGVATAALGSNLDDAGTASDKKVESQLDVRTRRRLEQLGESQDESRSTVRLTQQELITRVEVLESELRRAWEAEERVRALKIAIQVRHLEQYLAILTRHRAAADRTVPPVVVAAVQDARRHLLPAIPAFSLCTGLRCVRLLWRGQPTPRFAAFLQRKSRENAVMPSY